MNQRPGIRMDTLKLLEEQVKSTFQHITADKEFLDGSLAEQMDSCETKWGKWEKNLCQLCSWHMIHI